MNQRTLPIVLLAAVFLAASSFAGAYEIPESNCTASVKATLQQQENTDDGGARLQFSVEVTSTEDCADVDYDLVIEEWMTNDQTHRIRIPGNVRVTGEPVSEIVEHHLLPGYKLMSHEARVALCRVCVIEP